MARSAYDPIDPTDPDDAEELALRDVAAQVSAFDPAEPSESQKELIKAGGQLLVGVNHDLEEDRTGRLPRGTSPESVRGRVVVVDSFGTETISQFDVQIDGKADPDWVAVTEKYKDVAQGLPHTGPARLDLAAKMMAEVAERKRQRQKAAAPKPVPPAPKAAPLPQAAEAPAEDAREPVVVRVALGPGLGRLSVAYHDVVIQDRTLVLVADPPAPGAFSWAPPDPDPADPDPRPLELEVAGLPAPVRAFPVGLSYPYQGRLHHVLLIDRPSE